MEENILDLRFISDDLGKEVSVREFLCALLQTLWEEKEGFSGKRPFGNSAWDADLAKCLIEHKAVKGTLDSDGYIESCDWDEVDKVVIEKGIRKL